ncbi:hypothetical protein FSP39_023767 [Pinctada imbricata]|uniref:peptidylglycine monooxygenase n=1 Tax=Pinctada imbricata TaxID=66713 RepID=A0AA88YGI2_PINIB|nr:hypothetical protein FSP39_023767 [Pinctada imbricata]
MAPIMKTLKRDHVHLVSVMIITMIFPLVLTQKEITLDAVMKSAKPTRNDEYLCSSHKLPANEELYITQYKAIADAGRAHHILLFGCDEPAVDSKTWHCGRICKSQEQILFAWAKNADPLVLPDGVGFRVGANTQIKYIVVQVHYVHPLPETFKISFSFNRQRYLAGIYLLLAYSVVIPGKSEKVHADISCQFKASGPIYPFGYRTHAHSLGRVITGYQVNGTYHRIGKGNPQWPQAFYPVEDKIVIKPGDYLTGRCTYNSTGRGRSTYIGATANDEMCNFYIMFYMDANTRLQYHSCAGNNFPSLIRNMPKDADVPLPPNPALEEAAHGHHGHMGNPEGHDEEVKTTPKATPKPTLAPTTAKPTTENFDIGNVIDDILSNNKYIHPNALSRNTDLVNQDNIYQQESDGMYPREFIPDYNMNDYYNELENQRARKRFHSSPYASRPTYQRRPLYNLNNNDNLDYYDEDVGGYQYGEKDPNLSSRYKGLGGQAFKQTQ